MTVCIVLIALCCSNLNAQTNTAKKVEGWANVPGGTVWLEPGRQAYEHDTGLVRDLATGQKSIPVTPQTLNYVSPRQPYPTYPTPYAYPQPIAPMVQPNPYYAPWVDVGPYGRQPCYDCGAISSGKGAIQQRWKTVGSLPR